MIHDKNYMETPEKRRTPRLYQTLDATLSHGDVLNHKAICKNISEGGVCLEVELEEVNERALWCFSI